MLGIDVIKKAFSAVFNLVEKVDEAYQDDQKIDFSEGLSISISTVPELYRVVKSKDELVAQYRDLDSSERKELVEWVKVEFDIDNDSAERKVEAFIEWVISTDKFIATLREA